MIAASPAALSIPATCLGGALVVDPRRLRPRPGPESQQNEHTGRPHGEQEPLLKGLQAQHAKRRPATVDHKLWWTRTGRAYGC